MLHLYSPQIALTLGVDELMKIIDDSLDDEYWIAKNPKRCLLNQYWNLENVPGYVVEIYDRVTILGEFYI